MLLLSEMETSLRFYVDGLGFEMTRRWMDGGALRWCLLRIGDAALMLQASANPEPPSFLTDGSAGGGVSIWFQCRDSLAIYQERD